MAGKLKTAVTAERIVRACMAQRLVSEGEGVIVIVFDDQGFNVRSNTGPLPELTTVLENVVQAMKTADPSLRQIRTAFDLASMAGQRRTLDRIMEILDSTTIATNVDRETQR